MRGLRRSGFYEVPLLPVLLKHRRSAGSLPVRSPRPPSFATSRDSMCSSISMSLPGFCAVGFVPRRLRSGAEVGRHTDPSREPLSSSSSAYIIGDGNNYYDFTYVENVAYGHIREEKTLSSEDGAKRAAGKTYFTANMEPIKFWEFMSLILEGLGYDRMDFFCLDILGSAFAQECMITMMMDLSA